MMPVDVIVLLLFVVITVVESVRGFGRALFDTIALLLVLKACKLASPSLATSITFYGSPTANAGFSFLLLFVVLGVVGLILAKLLYEALLWTLDAFDTFVGGLIGLITSGVVASALMHGLYLWGGGFTQHVAPFGIAMQTSWAGQQFLEWRTYYSVVGFLYSLGK
jgi:uncharacterized membrane protein required for colicin V production